MHYVRFFFILSLTLLSCQDDSSSSGGTPQQPASSSSVVVKRGTLMGQNGYSSVGTVEILRDTTNGNETLKTSMDFSVSGGAGAIGIWLTDVTGLTNVDQANTKLQTAVLTSSTGFSGSFSFSIPANSAINYSHVVTFCNAAGINFGYALFQDP